MCYNAQNRNEVCFSLGYKTLYLSREVPLFRRNALPLTSPYYYYYYYYYLLIYPGYGRSTLLRNIETSGAGCPG